MNKHYHTNDDDFEIINGRKVLKDGKTYRRGSLMLMDHNSRDARIADRIEARHSNRGPMRITDATGGPMGLHRPGWRVPAQDARPAGHVVTDAARQNVLDAREDYLRDLTSAWRGDAWRRDAGKQDVVPNAPKGSGNDAMPVDDVETAYRLYLEEIAKA